MTAKELANMLSGREYGLEITELEEQQAADAGLVVVYGYSDDNMEFTGAIQDEVGAYEGTTVYIGKDGLLPAPDCECNEDECQYLKKAIQAAKSIKAIWCGDTGASWAYETDIPHETFNIYEDGELFCIGIVFSMEDL